MTLAVMIVIFVVTKSRQLRELGNLGGPAGIFNVNEPIIFGLPIIMNPLIYPLAISSSCVAIVTYFAMDIGFAPKPAGLIVPWTTPALLSGYLATGNKIMGAVMQLINIGIVFVIWLPFLKLLDNQYYGEKQKARKS